MESMRRGNIVGWGVALLLLGARVASAGGLGIALDGFLATFLTFVTGLGIIIFMLGLGSYTYQWISVPHSPLLGNSLTMMVLGGIFGGGPIIATQLGLLSGAVLPGSAETVTEACNRCLAAWPLLAWLNTPT